jgi:hypothetical protein
VQMFESWFAKFEFEINQHDVFDLMKFGLL